VRRRRARLGRHRAAVARFGAGEIARGEQRVAFFPGIAQILKVSKDSGTKSSSGA
jgi:hypothetical protein